MKLINSFSLTDDEVARLESETGAILSGKHFSEKERRGRKSFFFKEGSEVSGPFEKMARFTKDYHNKLVFPKCQKSLVISSKYSSLSNFVLWSGEEIEVLIVVVDRSSLKLPAIVYSLRFEGGKETRKELVSFEGDNAIEEAKNFIERSL